MKYCKDEDGYIYIDYGHGVIEYPSIEQIIEQIIARNAIKRVNNRNNKQKED